MNARGRQRAAKAAAGRRRRDAAALLERAISQHRAGRLDAAESLYRRVLKIEPRQPDALNFLGVIAHEKGRSEEAIDLMRRAIAADGSVAAFHINLGEALRALGRGREALDHYRRAAELAPDFADAHFCLGTALAEAGDLENAIGALRRAVELNPGDVEALLALGRAMLDSGAVRDSVEVLERALARDPGLAEGHHLLGRAFYRLELFEQAEARQRRALALRPELAEAERDLARALAQLGRTEEALEIHRRMIERDPEDAQAAMGAGSVLLDDGRFEAAMEWFERALAIDPASARAHVNIGICHQQMGRFEEAVEWHEKALELDPHSGIAHVNLVTMAKYRNPEDRIRLITDVLENGTPSRTNRTALLFALARAYEASGDYDTAFRTYREANDLKKAEAPYDAAVFDRYVDRLVQTFTPELFAAKRKLGSPSNRPVFIVGMPRSGTTLVEQIVASHPMAFGAGELDDIRQLTRALPGLVGGEERFPECVRRLDAAAARTLSDRYLARLARLDPDAEIVTDKMPNNFQRLGFIALLFPKARILHCRRDPLDTCLSCYFQHFARAQWFSYDLSTLGRYYRGYERLMAHWREVLPLSVLDVPYEALVDDLEAWTRRILDHIGLPWDPRCLAFHETERQIKTASQWQARQPLYRSSVAKWRRYERHLEPLKRALGLED